MLKNQRLYELAWISRPLMQAVEACVERGLSDRDLTVRMRAVLEMLGTYGDLTVPEIAAKLEIQRQYVQVMVNETRGAGLTEQRENPRHKRSPLICLSASGRQVIRDVMEQEREVIDRLAIKFDPDEVATALRVVRQLTDLMKAEARRQ